MTTAPGPTSTLSSPFSEPQHAKVVRLFARLQALTAEHHAHCPAYAQMLDALHPQWRMAHSIAELPWLPVGIFKHLRLASVAEDAIVRELTSSGTTGTLPSRVLLDRATAQAQVRALAAIVTDFLGRERRPMLVLDRADLLSQGASLGARGAAVLGFATFGREHRYALTADMALDLPGIKSFIDACGERPALLFGFTALVWQHGVQALQQMGEHLVFPPGTALVHGGGWKKLATQAVDAARFKAAIAETLNIHRVHDYYGMAEQVGSIFMECEHGRLHAPGYAEVIVRDPVSFAPLQSGETGVIQVLSELPTSYPGHSLLTEDLGRVVGEDDCPCGRHGRTLAVQGRLPRAELRGCSDTRSA